jgi:DNA-binding NtrC family response regulator
MDTSVQRNARRRSKASIKIDDTSFPMDYREANAEFLRKYLTKVLKECDGNITEAARMLSISRRTLQLQATRLEIDVSAIRHGK